MADLSREGRILKCVKGRKTFEVSVHPVSNKFLFGQSCEGTYLPCYPQWDYQSVLGRLSNLLKNTQIFLEVKVKEEC